MDAYTTALNLLSRRELSAHQLRERLARRKFDPEEIGTTVDRLIRDRTVDDRRVARAFARMESTIKGRGRRRVLQAIQRLGIASDVAAEAVDEVFGEIDETEQFDRALQKRLRGQRVSDLDQKARARLIRQLVGQGYELSRVLRALHR